MALRFEFVCRRFESMALCFESGAHRSNRLSR
jgi:hypothetical protein